MAVKSIGEYRFEPRDRVENFHGNQLVYVHWTDHLMFCAPLAFPLPPAMPFGDFQGGVLPEAYGLHPDFAKIDWSAARWELDGEPFAPDAARGLAEQGIGHKSVVRLTTPGLTGIAGSCT